MKRRKFLGTLPTIGGSALLQNSSAAGRVQSSPNPAQKPSMFYTTGRWITHEFPSFKQELTSLITTIGDNYYALQTASEVSPSKFEKLEQTVRKAEQLILRTVPKYYSVDRSRLQSAFKKRRQRRQGVLKKLKQYAKYNETDRIATLLKKYAVKKSRYGFKPNIPSNKITWRQYTMAAEHPDIDMGACCQEKPRMTKFTPYVYLSFVSSPSTGATLYRKEKMIEAEKKVANGKEMVQPLPVDTANTILAGSLTDKNEDLMQEWGVGSIEVFKQYDSSSAARKARDKLLNQSNVNHEGTRSNGMTVESAEKIAWKNQSGEWVYAFLIQSEKYLALSHASNVFWGDKTLQGWLSTD
ncbi:hypothetical protein M0R89_12470 [Halorussus limi]|uniref:Uncharacterized protein n=1 Tax=Halorussus limi TaxID=2938695 RepID=A0A8U0HR46_9EURY|nr:hypothetical protein [Halorussus limi]UPV73358.1 hypothetical protein M0R89_12470 [Halorussus limi]